MQLVSDKHKTESAPAPGDLTAAGVPLFRKALHVSKVLCNTERARRKNEAEGTPSPIVLDTRHTILSMDLSLQPGRGRRVAATRSLLSLVNDWTNKPSLRSPLFCRGCCPWRSQCSFLISIFSQKLSIWSPSGGPPYPREKEHMGYGVRRRGGGI